MYQDRIFKLLFEHLHGLTAGMLSATLPCTFLQTGHINPPYSAGFAPSVI